MISADTFRGILLVASLVLAPYARAQQVADGSSRAVATRADLLAAKAAAEQDAHSRDLDDDQRRGRSYEAALIASRLAEGDFSPGDRVVLRVEDEPALSDTFTVRAGRRLPLASLPDLELSGVLRSELRSHVEDHLRRFIREPKVDATPLVRVAVFGPVGRPGFYAVPADVLLSELIMRAGGPSPTADMSRLEIRRDGRTLWSAGEVRVAVAQGFTLDQLHVRAGDEIVLTEQRQRDWSRPLQAVMMILGTAVTVLSLTR